MAPTLIGSSLRFVRKAMQPASIGNGPPQKAAPFAVKTMETKMRVITVSELRLLSRAQLYSLRVQFQAVLADLPQGSVEYQFAVATLENIRAIILVPALHM